MTHVIPMRLKRARVSYVEAISQQPVMLQCDGEARARLEDFSKFFDTLAAEAQEAKAQLQTNNVKITALSIRLNEQDDVIKEQESRLNVQDEKFKQTTEIMVNFKEDILEKQEMIQELEEKVETYHSLVTKQNAQINEQKSQIIRLELEKRNIEDKIKTHSEYVHAAQEQFIDCITLDQNANCILLTSGQHTNLEGIVKIWMYNDNFSGDVWFPFQCPVTKTTTMPVRDLCEFLICL